MTVTTTPSFIAPAEHRHEPSSFDPTIDTKDAPSIVTTLRTADDTLKIYTRSSPNFETLRGLYNKLITHQPLVICRPQTIEQIQLIIRTARAANPPIPVVPRCGGHDVYGRGLKPDSISIDMRELDTQLLAEDRESIRIGGGVTSQNFVGFLDNHGLCTANGTAGNVGWTGWAVWGGYGPLNDYVGLGVDNILSAKLVLADGSLVEADAGSELLWGVRGAGGGLGVIVETTVKVYPMPVILAGFIAYQWGASEKVLLGLQDLLDRGIPDTMCLQMGFMKTKWGVGMSLIFAWPDSKTLDEGRTWLETVRGLGEIQVDTVGESKLLFLIRGILGVCFFCSIVVIVWIISPPVIFCLLLIADMDRQPRSRRFRRLRPAWWTTQSTSPLAAPQFISSAPRLSPSCKSTPKPSPTVVSIM